MKKIVQRRFDESTRDVLTIVQGPCLQPVFWEAIEDIQRFCTRNKAITKVGHGTLTGGT